MIDEITLSHPSQEMNTVMVRTFINKRLVGLPVLMWMVLFFVVGSIFHSVMPNPTGSFWSEFRCLVCVVVGFVTMAHTTTDADAANCVSELCNKGVSLER
jgi:hypothetical protein